MTSNPSVKKILFGGDWNPEQWGQKEREEDMRLLPKAGVDIVTVNVFSWASLQPSEDEYDFSDLDKIIDMAEKAGMSICLATSTATAPAWMAKKYPEILRVDIEGRKHQFGGRQNSCPNSAVYRKYSALLAARLAERYGNHKSVLAWHISNEYGGLCYCERCRAAFRAWLKNKYGSVEKLNEAWNTAFWGHKYYDWDEIQVPMNTSEQWAANRTTCQIQTIDYCRFQSGSLLECLDLEANELKKFSPKIPITTNFMGGPYRELDYHEWARHLDFVSLDNYPSPNDSYSYVAFNLETTRGCKPGKPFVVMEQTPSVTNWQPYNSLKRPGALRMQCWQEVAHGADAVMFFQMRRARGCCEKWHGAVIDWRASEETRVFKEVSKIGGELRALGGEILGSTQDARVAVIFDWDCLWGTMFSAGPSADFDYSSEVFKYYDAFSRENIPVDVIARDEDLSKYKVLVAPALYMLREETARSIKEFVRAGGTLVTTCMSGMVDKNDLATLEGFPGLLREVAGVWVEETDALLPSRKNSFHIESGDLRGDYPAAILCDIIHLEGAEAVAVYGSDFYKGTPAICRNDFGAGEAWYVGSCAASGNDALLRKLARHVCARRGISPLAEPLENVEVTKRVSRDGRVFLFILNHSGETARVAVPSGGVERLTGAKIAAGEFAAVAPNDVAVVALSK